MFVVIGDFFGLTFFLFKTIYELILDVLKMFYSEMIFSTIVTNLINKFN